MQDHVQNNVHEENLEEEKRWVAKDYQDVVELYRFPNNDV